MSPATIAPDTPASPPPLEEMPRNSLPQAAALAPSFWDRPPGWLGWWSKRYARVIARSLGSPLPYGATALADQLAATPPLPFAEALDPLASDAEPRDRDGRLLPWHLERSATFDLFGYWGVMFGALTVGLVILTFAISHTVGQAPTPKGTDAPRARDANPEVDVPQQQQQQQQPPNPARVTTPPDSKSVLPIAPPSDDQPNLKSQTPNAAAPNQRQQPLNVAPGKGPRAN